MWIPLSSLLPSIIKVEVEFLVVRQMLPPRSRHCVPILKVCSVRSVWAYKKMKADGKSLYNVSFFFPQKNMR